METLIKPYLRKAVFTEAQPQMNKGMAKHIGVILIDSWESYKEDYINTVIKEIEGIENIKFTSESPRMSEENDKAFVVDHPLLEFKYKDIIYESRLITAICYDKLSTKNWTRIGVKKFLPYDENTTSQLKILLNKFAKKSCNWSHNRMTSIIENEMSRNAKSIGDFTVYTIGVQDMRIGRCLGRFDDLGINLKSILASDDLRNLLEDYYFKIFKLPVETDKKNKDHYWFTSQVNIENNLHHLTNENVLYNFNAKGSSLNAFGIGYDNSFEGNLGKISSLKIARYYGGQI